MNAASSLSTFLPMFARARNTKWFISSTRMEYAYSLLSPNLKAPSSDSSKSPPATHISDLVRLYGLLVGKILQKEPIPTGENGYYFAMAHRLPWWKVMERLAAVMHVQGLVTSPEVKTWPSYELAAETLRFPLLYLPAMGTSTGDLIPVNAFKLGWQPIWTEGMLLESIDDEVQAALESDNVNMTLFDALTK